ncbi:proton-coupled folate transporter-like [Ptychodera flava]|uniref:proton-coupled folate transporter-like n=1 Tax=Ptychodera flava TaxID=63121 RepID=UPI00396A1F82
MFSYSSLTAIRVEYVKQAVGKLHNYSPHTSGSVCDVNKSDPNYILGEKVQSEASYWLLYFEVVSAVLTLFSGMLLGSYSERGGGRKTVLLVSVVGLALHVFCVLLVLILSLPIGYLFIAEIIRGVTGNTFTVMAMSFAFIADISSEKNRTIRMIILEAMLFVGGGVAQGATGGWIQSAGFIPPMWLIYGAFIASLFYVLVWLEETVRKQEISEWSISETCLDIVQLFSKASRETSIQLVIYNVCLFALFLIIGSNMSLTTLYMLDAPFCFTPVYVGYYLAIMFSANAVGK